MPKVGRTQMQYTELIKIFVGTDSKAYYFEKFSGGELTFAQNERKGAGTVMSKFTQGRGKLSEITLERTKEAQDSSLVTLYAALQAAIMNGVSVTVTRVQYATPSAGRDNKDDGKTSTQYQECQIVSFNDGDGDVTSDDGAIMQQFKFQPTHKEEFNGKTKTFSTRTLDWGSAL